MGRESMERLQICSFPGQLESLKRIAQFVLAAAEAAGLDKKRSYQLRQAVDEIATNSIIHGYHEANLQGELVCQASWDDTAVAITLEDTGIPFDPTQQPAPSDLTKSLDQRAIGGLGIHLAKQSVDQFFYERVGDRNRNKLLINRA